MVILDRGYDFVGVVFEFSLGGIVIGGVGGIVDGVY